MEKEFVPYELSVKLREIGFDELCLCHYHHVNILRGKIVSYVDGDCLKLDKFDKSIPAPLWQQAARFLSVSSNNKINITINGKDNYKELCEKFKKAVEDFGDL